MVAGKQTLRQSQIFSSLSNTQLEEVASLAEEKQYEAGTTLFQEGESAAELLVLQEGKVALQMTMPEALAQMSRRITVDIVSRNEVVGWSAIVEPHVYTLTAICLQKVKALSISNTKLRRLLRDNHKIGFEVLNGLIKVVASRMDETRRVLVSERLLPLQPSKTGSM